MDPREDREGKGTEQDIEKSCPDAAFQLSALEPLGLAKAAPARSSVSLGAGDGLLFVNLSHVF